ncbi:MAG: exopolyphosphatase [Rhodospirillales bacterium 70-18]|nr:Ppx/GppA family phosphatase [Rhodospirillales bacterium]OJY71807.1 MAG: exopolyphosphatase [Rhodospirillales bacterium 70-18]
MPFSPPAGAARCAVVDLGSNSVRLVVFEGSHRNPVPIFNEKAVLRLGRGLQATGLLNEEAVAQTLTVMNRYAAIARAMGADPFEVLATAAVRDARNGPDFVAGLRARLPGAAIRVLSGEQEAELSAAGMLCGIPDADGVLADIGGGSLEVVRLRAGQRGLARTLPLGVLRLSERAGGDAARARAIAETELAGVPWLAEGAGRDLYAVGGAWRALARIHIAQTGYPLNMVHHYTISRDEARDLTSVIAGASRRALERMPGVPRRRVEDLPFAAVALRRVLRATGARRVVFSANGLREGWYMERMTAEMRARDPLLSAGQELAERLGRDPTLPPALLAWTDPLFVDEPAAHRRLREAACWMSDIGSHDHPEYRAEQAYLRILRQPGIGLDHLARAFLALTLALRYEAEPDAPFLSTARMLLGPEDTRRATILGVALRLAYTLSAGTPDLLAGTRLAVDHALTLHLAEGGGVFAGESVTRRLDRLAVALGLDAATKLAA